jgi:hypothetical protein
MTACAQNGIRGRQLRLAFVEIASLAAQIIDNLVEREILFVRDFE